MGVTKTMYQEGSGVNSIQGQRVIIKYTGFLKDSPEPDNKGEILEALSTVATLSKLSASAKSFGAGIGSAAGQRPSRPQEPAEAPQPADDPNFSSILDNPPELVRSGRRHGPGILILVLIPVAAFALGTWQVFRLRWKTDMLAKCEDRLVRPPLPLGLNNVADAAEVSLTGDASDFDYRRIVAVGSFRHDQEMLVGPRVRDGQAGFFVVTPLELAVPLDGSADGAPPATILVNRGWIARGQRPQAAREHTPGALPEGLVRVEGLLRAPWKRNVFTPDNRPDKGEFYFPDVVEMAQLTGSLPVWVEATMEPDLLQIYDMEAKGIPIGKPPEVNIRNSHAQYIFTWYSLSVATSVMLWMVLRKPPSDMARRVRMNKSW
ncbi:cox1 assembly protein [Grosmannia clavigera kw1407]|uniref:SURF1-like protein n=1 Tax=Grosmannia clavigera (strain kw1407 / UAMH 11150) TaxID=655863 RepID=F0XUL9_GROCL|nr:cox1 assembly protein [Grosmannia clavigera kw1407]EFW98631.1 cox1 assembly protein [Grosmannia clavigera kw1407]